MTPMDPKKVSAAAWKSPIPLGVARLAFSPDGDLVVVETRKGERACLVFQCC